MTYILGILFFFLYIFLGTLADHLNKYDWTDICFKEKPATWAMVSFWPIFVGYFLLSWGIYIIFTSPYWAHKFFKFIIVTLESWWRSGK